MERYSTRQVSTIFEEEPTSTAAPGVTSSYLVQTDDNANAVTLLCGADGLTSLESNSGPCTLGVTEGCRTCIDDFSKAQMREYFLKQQCLPRMAWVKISGDAPATVASFEENAAHSLRSSNSITNLQNAESRSGYGEGRAWRGSTHTSRARADRPTINSSDSSSSRRIGMWTDDTLRSASDVKAPSEGKAAGEEEEEEEVCVLPPARFGHTAVLYKEAQIIVFGGKANDEHYYNDVYAYDVEGRRWTALQKEEAEEEGTTAGLASSSSSSSSSGGGNGTAASPSPFTSALSLSERRTARARPATATLATTRDAAAAAASTLMPEAPSLASTSRANTDDGSHHSAGGHTAIFSPTTSPTTTPAPRSPRPCGRVGHAAALYQDTMFVLSGERQGKYFDDMWSLHMSTRTWSKECGLPFAPRKGHTMHLLPAESTANRTCQDMLVVFGGLVRVSRLRPRPADPELPTRSAGDPDMICAPTNETLLYYPTQRRWCQLKTCGDVPTPRFYHVSQLVTGTSLLLLFGGRTVAPAPVGTTAASAGSFMNDLHILDVSTGMWRQIRDFTGDVPSPRMCAASVFVNGTFAVFAGGGDGYCQQAYEFQLCENRWRRLTPNYQPACSRPTVTYAKDRLVFFGGFAPRKGVMNCTMELCLAPLSLSNQCMLWWNRCAFEKHVRTCTRKRILEQQEKAAAKFAMTQCCKADGNCGKQVTLHHSPGCSASGVLPTPRSSMMHRGTRRPAPFQAPGYDRANSWSASINSAGGHHEAYSGSPSSSYAPSSPVVCSPLSGVSQSMPAWQDAAAGLGGVVGKSGILYSAAFAACASSFRGSPASLRGANTFPSRPDGVSPIHAGSALSSTAAASSSSGAMPLGYPNAWSRPAATATSHMCQHRDPPPPWTPQQTHHSGNAPSSVAVAARMQQSAVAVRTWTDSVQCNSGRASASTTQGDGAPTASLPGVGVGVLPQGQLEQGCTVAKCMRTITGLVARTVPRIHMCHPPPAAAFAPASPPSQALQGHSPLTSQSLACPLNIDVNARTPPSPQPSDASWHRLHSPGVLGHAGGLGAATAFSSALPSPDSQPQKQQCQQRQQGRASAHGSESPSSRASSMHSARSISSEALALSHVKQLIEQLEGPNGPFLFRAMANRMQKRESISRPMPGKG